jgi:hypothetical protein
VIDIKLIPQELVKNWKDRLGNAGKNLAGWTVIGACVFFVVEVKSAYTQLPEIKTAISELKESKYNGVMSDSSIIFQLREMKREDLEGKAKLIEKQNQYDKELMCMKAEIYRLDKMHGLRNLQDEKLLKDYLQ